MARLVGFWNQGAAERLHKALEEKGLRVEELANRIGVSEKTVRNWRRMDKTPNVPDVENFMKLCKELNLSADDFRRAADNYNRQRENQRADVPSEKFALPAEVLSGGTTGEHRRVRYLAPWALALASVTGLLVVVLVMRSCDIDKRSSGKALSKPSLATFTIPQEHRGVYDRAFGGDVSPDGAWVAFVARSLQSMKRMLFVYSVADHTVRPLPQSEGNYTSFFWNTDSRTVFFVNKVDLMRISVSGEDPERIGYVGEGLKGAVNRDGIVVLGSRRGLLRAIPGGQPEALTRLRLGDIAHSYPLFLPDGDHLLFVVTRNVSSELPQRWLAVLSLRTREWHTLFPISSRVLYAAGQLLYARGRTLFARPFDVNALAFTEAERAIAAPIWYDGLIGDAGFSASASTLFLVPPAHVPPLHHVTRSGTIDWTISNPRDIDAAAVGHVTRQLAIVGRGEDGDDPALWLYPLDGRERVQLFDGGGPPSSPTFSADDSVLYYATAATSWANIYSVDLRAVVKTPHPVRLSTDIIAPRDVSPDGHYLLFEQWHNRDGNLWYLPIAHPKNERPLVVTPEDEGESARFSPDGQKVAFVAKRGGIFSIFVMPFPPTGQLAQQVISNDGWRVRWSVDGKSIYYVQGSDVMEANLASRQSRRLFGMKREISIFETAEDGGFLVRETSIEQPRTVVTGWWPTLANRELPVHRDAD